MYTGVLSFRSGHSLTEFASEERVERSKNNCSPRQVSTTKFCSSFFSCCARSSASSYVRVVGLVVNLNLVEGWRSEPLKGASCCLNCGWFVNKTRATVIKSKCFGMLGYGQSRETVILRVVLVCSARNSTLGCEHIK